MSTDPKKNDEIKDEDLENVSGGVIEQVDAQLEDGGTPSKRPEHRPRD